MKLFGKIYDWVLGLADPRRPASVSAAAWVAMATLALDQATKLAAVHWLASQPRGYCVTIISNFLDLSYATNTGAAFSSFSGHAGVLTIVRAIVSLGLVAWIVKLPRGEQGLRPVLGLILGGAIGNLIDGARLGHVIDFILAHWFDKAYWPTFNVADSAVCVGMALLIIASFRWPSPEAAAPKDARPPDSPPDARADQGDRR